MAEADATTAVQVAHLPDVVYVSKKRVYYFCVPLDAWLIVVKPGFLSTAADFAAWQVAADCEVRGVSDSAALEGNRNIALPLPTMARQVVRGLVETHGRPSLLSVGWLAACRRMARLLEDCPTPSNG